MRNIAFVLGLALLVAGAPKLVVAQENSAVESTADPLDRICSTIEDVARSNGLPTDFLVRLIWQESRFNPSAVGPTTRNGGRAQGIAQFMPGTAAERHLTEPNDPAEALPKSGEFLAELRDKFGNLGLAAAAYNAGPARVSEFIARSRVLPAETRHYVLAVTGRSIDDWARAGKIGINEETDHSAPAVNCRDFVELPKQASKPEAEQHPAPNWCQHLHHPNANLCGTVHEPELPKISLLPKLR